MKRRARGLVRRITSHGFAVDAQQRALQFAELFLFLFFSVRDIAHS